MEKIILSVLGLILIIGGIILLFRKNVEKFVTWNNKFRGVKTEITEQTYIGYKTYAVIIILIGLISILWN